MNVFNNVPLKEVCKVISGYAFKSATFKTGGNTPVIKIKNIKIGTASLEDAGYVDSSFLESVDKKYKVMGDDILISLTGSHMTQPNSVVGRVGRYPCKYPVALLNQRAGKVIPNEELVDKTYLFYALLGDDLRREIAQMAHGAASQANVSPSQVESVEIPLPALKLQKKIGSILNNYDQLIENNNRRIAMLEDMAQSLYREWFVNFRYPNHKDNLDADGNPKLVDSPLGQIPEGWEVKRLDDVASVNPQSITKKNAPDEIGYIDIKSVGTGTINEVKPMSFDDAPSRARRVVVDGDIIWATVRPNRRQCSFICKPALNTIASTGFAVLRSKSLPASYLYSFTTTDSFTGYLVNHATGSAYPAVNADIFKKADVLVPPLALVQKFDEVCSDAISQSEVLKKKNKNLKQQRDMLLPKLISGQIELKD